MGKATTVLNQSRYIGRNDDGSEITATSKAAEDTGWGQPVDTPFRVRFGVLESGGLGDTFQFFPQYRINGGAWTNISTSASINMLDSPNIVHQELTTKQTSLSGTFVAGSVQDTNTLSVAIAISANGHTEVEWSLMLNSASVAVGDLVELQLLSRKDLSNSVFTGSYIYPQITAQAAAPPPDTTPPTDPTGLTVTAVEDPALTWTNSTDAVAFDTHLIERKTGAAGTWGQIGTSVSSPYTDATAEFSTEYFYRVRGRDAAGNLSVNYSNEQGVTTPAAPPPDTSAIQPSEILGRVNFSGSVELIQDDPNTPDAKRHWVNIDDAIQRRTRSELKTFTDWLTNNGVKGYLGEFGWPQTKDTYEWNRVADTYYDALEDSGVMGTQWAAGGNWPSTYVILSYGESTATSAAEVIERHLEKGTLYRGVNVAGAEFSHTTLANGTLFSNVNPGVHGTDYFYPSAAHLSHIYNRGVKTIRLPFRWERWQKSLLGALDTTEMGHVHRVLVDANAAGLKVILDCHNYARYMLGTDTATRTEMIMTKDGDLNYTHLNDFWAKVSQWVKADVTRDATVFAYGLMNEPNGMSAWTAPFTPSITYSTFETDTEGWLADTGVTLARSTAQAHTGLASLTATKAFAATGYDQIRPRSADRAVGSRDLSANGNTMVVRVFIPSTAPGTGWTASLYLFDSAFANIQPGPDTALTKGQWTEVASNFTTTQLSDVISMGVQVGASDINGTVDVYIDQYEQGSSSGTISAAEVWEGATQEALTAIRNVPDNRLITIAGYQWSGVQNWTTNHPDKWITDAQNNYVYEAHHYWDKVNGYTGTYPDTYAVELTQAQTDGW